MAFQGYLGRDVRRLAREATSMRALKTLREYVDNRIHVARTVGWPALVASYERDMQAIEQAMREMEAVA